MRTAFSKLLKFIINLMTICWHTVKCMFAEKFKSYGMTIGCDDESNDDEIDVKYNLEVLQVKEEAILSKFSERMTVLKKNPSRFKDIRFTKYFGGICICYYDARSYKYVVERICTDVDLQEGKDNDSKSDSILESGRNETQQS